MSAQVRVRVARPDDARALAEVQVRGWQAGYAGLLPQDMLDGLTVERRLPVWRDRVAAPGDPRTGELALVGEVGGKVVGELVCGPTSCEDAAPTLAEVYLLYVDPDHWGVGVGYALTMEAERRLAARGFTEVGLWVIDGNTRARRAYERYGYRPTGERRHDPVFDVDDLEYRARLTSD